MKLDGWNTISFWDGLFSGAMLVLESVIVGLGSWWFVIRIGVPPKNPNPFQFRGFQESKPPTQTNNEPLVEQKTPTKNNSPSVVPRKESVVETFSKASCIMFCWVFHVTFLVCIMLERSLKSVGVFN